MVKSNNVFSVANVDNVANSSVNCMSGITSGSTVITSGLSQGTSLLPGIKQWR